MLLLGFETVSRWARNFDDSGNYLRYFGEFLVWLGERSVDVDPDGFVELQAYCMLSVDRRKRFYVKGLVGDFVKGKEMRASSKAYVYSALCSFFAYNWVELPRNPNFRVKSSIPKTVGRWTVREAKLFLAS